MDINKLVDDCISAVHEKIKSLNTLNVVIVGKTGVGKSTLVTSVVGTTGATILGRTVVSNLCKLIPGAGSIAGGVISGATASLMTTALGEAYIGIMIAMFKGEIKEKDLLTKEGKTKLTDLFQENLRRFKIEKNINIK